MDIFARFKKTFGVPLNQYIKRTGPLVSFDAVKFDKWIQAGDESTIAVADRKFGAGAGDLVLQCNSAKY